MFSALVGALLLFIQYSRGVEGFINRLNTLIQYFEKKQAGYSRVMVQLLAMLTGILLFVETSINPKLIREIARDTGVKIGGSLYSDSMGERGSAGEAYIGMMRENVLLIVAALKP